MTIPESSPRNVYPCFTYTLRKLSKSIMPMPSLPESEETFLDSSAKAIGLTPKFFKNRTPSTKGSGITKGKNGRKTPLNIGKKSNRADRHAILTSKLETEVLLKGKVIPPFSSCHDG